MSPANGVIRARTPSPHIQLTQFTSPCDDSAGLIQPSPHAASAMPMTPMERTVLFRSQSPVLQKHTHGLNQLSIPRIVAFVLMMAFVCATVICIGFVIRHAIKPNSTGHSIQHQADKRNMVAANYHTALQHIVETKPRDWSADDVLKSYLAQSKDIATQTEMSRLERVGITFSAAQLMREGVELRRHHTEVLVYAAQNMSAGFDLPLPQNSRVQRRRFREFFFEKCAPPVPFRVLPDIISASAAPGKLDMITGSFLCDVHGDLYKLKVMPQPGDSTAKKQGNHEMVIHAAVFDWAALVPDSNEAKQLLLGKEVHPNVRFVLERSERSVVDSTGANRLHSGSVSKSIVDQTKSLLSLRVLRPILAGELLVAMPV